MQLLASRLDSRDALQIRREGIGSESLRGHLDKRDEGTSEVGQLSATAVDNGSCRDDDTSVLLHDFYGLGDTSAACYDILRDHKFLALADFEASAQDESAIAILFDENVVGTEVSSDLLTHNDTTNGGRNNRCILCKRSEFFR